MFVLRSDGSMWWAVAVSSNHLLAVVRVQKVEIPGAAGLSEGCPHMAVLTAVSLSSSCCIGTQMIPEPVHLHGDMFGSCVGTDSLQLSLVLWPAVFGLFCNPVSAERHRSSGVTAISGVYLTINTIGYVDLKIINVPFTTVDFFFLFILSLIFFFQQRCIKYIKSDIYNIRNIILNSKNPEKKISQFPLNY